MTKSLITALIILLSANAFSQKSESFDFNGQESESIILDLIKSVTKYQDKEVDSTCTREEPYQTQECGNVTKYKRECRYQPGYNDCRDVYDRQCHYETRYRQECHNGPSRRECRTEPGQRVCRNEPGKTVCRTNSRGENVCRTVPGRQVCETRPGRQVCRNVPGQRVCRSVPYQENVCRNVTRRQCDYVPGRDVCENVPYNEYECKMVTKYRSVDYACKKTIQVPYNEDVKIENRINFNFVGNIELADAKITAELSNDGIATITAKNRSNLALMTIEKDVRSVDSTSFVTNVYVNVLDRQKHFEAVNLKSHGLWMSKKGDYSLVLDKTDVKNFKMVIKVITRSDDDTHFIKEFRASDFEVKADGDDRVKLVIDLEKHGFKRLRGFLGRDVKLAVESTISVEEIRNVLGEKSPEASQNHIFKIKVD